MCCVLEVLSGHGTVGTAVFLPLSAGQEAMYSILGGA